MYISLADSAHFASRAQLGVYFSANAISANNTINLPYTPQVIVSPNNYIDDKVNWVEYNMQYKATGSEEYITIGNFFDTTSLDTQYVAGGGNQFWQLATYYYIDDVWLSTCDSLPPSNSTGINEKTLEKKIKLYPNPVNSVFNIEFKGNKALSFQLFDALGTVIPIIVTARNEAVYNINVGDIPKGIYFLKVNDRTEQASFKLIKN